MQNAMENDLFLAKEQLANGKNTCVLRKGGSVYTSEERGVKPLLEWLDSGLRFAGYSAADRVVGNGAAFLYVLSGVSAVYAGVMSQAALRTLTSHGIRAEYGCLTDAIKNRAGTGICPIEEAVSGVAAPEEALQKIRSRLAELARQSAQA